MKSVYYLHRKTGGIYRILTTEYVRTDCREGEQIMPMYVDDDIAARPYTVTDSFPADTFVVFYENVLTGQRWARAFKMFGDGRFAQFDEPPLDLIPPRKAEGAKS